MITLKTLHNASSQEVFDQVVTHLLTQNRKCVSEDSGNCVYHGPNGLKCAAGCLIADGEYKRSMEGNGWGELVLLNNGFPSDHKQLIQTLQNVHDRYWVSEWLRELLKVAKKFDLNPEVVRRFEDSSCVV